MAPAAATRPRVGSARSAQSRVDVDLPFSAVKGVNMHAYVEEHKAEMRAIRQTKLFNDFASYSKRRDAERKSGSAHDVSTAVDAAEEIIASDTMARAKAALRSGGSRKALNDPPVSMMLGMVHREARKTGRERKGVWSEVGKPYELGQYAGRDASGAKVVRTGAMVEVARDVRSTFPARTMHPEDVVAVQMVEVERRRAARRAEEDAVRLAEQKREDSGEALAAFLREAGYGGGGDDDGDRDDIRGGGSLDASKNASKPRPASGGATLSSQERRAAMFPREQLNATRKRALAAKAGGGGFFTNLDLDMELVSHMVAAAVGEGGECPSTLEGITEENSRLSGSTTPEMGTSRRMTPSSGGACGPPGSRWSARSQPRSHSRETVSGRRGPMRQDMEELERDDSFLSELRAAAPRMSSSAYDPASFSGASPPSFPTFPRSSISGRHCDRGDDNESFAELKVRKGEELRVYLEGREATVRRARGSGALASAAADEILRTLSRSSGRASPASLSGMGRRGQGGVWARAEKNVHSKNLRLAAEASGLTARPHSAGTSRNSHRSAGSRAWSGGSATGVDQAELDGIEEFYERLCHLVELQRVSDPLSVSIVHKVKSLLEMGVGLNDKGQTLLTKVVDHVRELAEIGGVSDNNKYALPILNLIRRGCDIPAADLERMLKAAKLDFLIASAMEDLKAERQRRRSTFGQGGGASSAGGSVRLKEEGEEEDAPGPGLGAVGTPSRDRRVHGVRGEGGRALDFEC